MFYVYLVCYIIAAHVKHYQIELVNLLHHHVKI